MCETHSTGIVDVKKMVVAGLISLLLITTGILSLIIFPLTSSGDTVIIAVLTGLVLIASGVIIWLRLVRL